MRRILGLIAGLLILVSTAPGQSIRVTFAAKDSHTAAFVQLDSVRIENLSTMRDTVIKAPFVIELDIATLISDRLPGLVHSLEISGNFANPFTDATNFTVATTIRGSVQIELFSIAGRREADLNAELEAGEHQFSLKAASLPAGVYLLVARAGQFSSSVRIVKSGAAGGGSPAILHTGISDGRGSGGFRKATAALFRFTGYAGTYHPESIEAAPLGDTAVVFDMSRVAVAPVIDRFVCLNPVTNLGDTAVFEVAASSALKSLSRILIDFDSDGVMDDSASASGGSAQATFRHAYTAAGSYQARACVTDLYGNTSCKDLDSSVTILDPKPLLTTAPVTEIRPTSAKSGGNITSGGISPVTARGVCWSTSPGPTTADNKTSDGAGMGVFASSITGLMEKTNYYIRAYATNSSGTSYGNEITFQTADPGNFLPILTTDSVKDITLTTAASGGNITSDGGYTVTARGVCWSTSAGATTANDKTSDGGGTGSFTSSITGLTENTTYYIRAYATNSSGTGYGIELKFKTADSSDCLPFLTTEPVSEITATTSSSGGNITSDGGYAVTDRGVCWSTSSGPTTADDKTSDGAGTGSFASSITGLAANTTYYVRAYAANSVGTGYGNEIVFTTAYPTTYLPVLTTTPVTEIMTTTAKSGGNITFDGGFPVTERGVCWSTSPRPISDGKTSDGTGTGTYSSSISGLTPNTTYYVRAYATNDVGTGYGNELSFKTIDPTPFLPVLTTVSVSEITTVTARTGGNISSDGGYPVTARGVCFSTSQNPTTSDNKWANNGTGTGSFVSMFAGLAANTTYYVRAYAVNSMGTGYGNEVSFTTQQCSGGESVTIGTQVWMLKNLDVDHYRNGDPIPQVTDSAQWLNLTTGAWCYYNNDPAMGAIYGKLYNWYAVNDPRGLAPAGWHVASDAEWKNLEYYVGGSSVAGGKLKEAGTSHWMSPNTGADNSSCFTALPGGERCVIFWDMGSVGYWWTSSGTSSKPVYAWAWLLDSSGTAYRFDYQIDGLGFSVRCVRD